MTQTPPTDPPASPSGSLAARIHAKLDAAFHPEHLEVIDESEGHRGHAGWREGGETHFRVVMRAASLDGLSRVAQSRAVHTALAEELATRIHALALDLSAGR